MSANIIQSSWTSVVLATQAIMAEVNGLYDEPLAFIDWEAHANIHELPPTDLIGPTALSVTEDTPGMFIMTFAIGVSTTTSDENLFRLRTYIDRVFNTLRYGQKMSFMDIDTNTVTGFMHFTEGTSLVPMSRADTRPWQYVQATALMEPFILDT